MPRIKKTTKQKKTSAEPLDKKPPVLSQNAKDGFYIVGIGASAGGLEALELFFRHMPPDSGMGFVLVPHLDPKRDSLMPDLIQRHTKMEVIEIKDGTKVLPNKIYIVPSNRELGILNGILQLLESTGTPGTRLPINQFFQSLAQDRGERAIGIVLSGMGTDGSLGLRGIKGQLGMVMAQAPESAKFDGMPRSAIETHLADYVLPVEKMPNQLIKYIKGARMRAVSEPSSGEGNLPEFLQKIFILLRSHTGHDFTHYKLSTIQRRIERRMNIQQISEVSSYIHYLQQSSQEVEALFKDLLINVTSFFRDPKAFEILKGTLKAVFRDKPQEHFVRVWVPGCSSGEEAFSVAMILQETMDELDKHFQVQIFGTDLDDFALGVARAGVYPDNISVDINPGRLKQFFIKDEHTYKIKKEIRDMLVFATQNITKDPPFTNLDLISCRNLLIYMDSTLQKKLLPIFHYSLKSGGILFLGLSETVGGFTDLFSAEDKKQKIFRRRKSSSATHAFVNFPITPRKGEEAGIRLAKLDEFNMSRLVEKILLKNYAPPSVIINEKGDILYIHGRTGKYLEPASGEAKLNIIEMAREGLRQEISSAIQRANSQRKEVICHGLRVRENSGFHYVQLTVKALFEPRAPHKLLLVVFKEEAPTEKEKTQKNGVSNNEGGKRIEALEQELQFSRENLQSLIEELETSNEELQSTNEELQSTNEELQSANEELETTKEEQQSLNEELITVNSELQNKIDDFSRVNRDMRYLLDNMEIPTIFLDNELNIRQFTSYATRIVNLIASDIGRPIAHITTNLKSENLKNDAEKVLNDLHHIEREVETNEDQWFLMRCIPYRTSENVFDGILLTFQDIHAQKKAAEKEKALSEAYHRSMDYAENIVNTLREGLLILDKDLKIISANRSFLNKFQVTEEETLGTFLYDLCDGDWDIPKLRNLLDQVILKKHFFEDFLVDHEFTKIGMKKMLLNARKFVQEKSSDDLILLAFEDITERQK